MQQQRLIAMQSGNLHALTRPPLTRRTVVGGSTWLDRWALSQIRRSLAGARVQLVLWNGFEAGPLDAEPLAAITFNTRAALLRCAWNPDLNFGEGYMSGGIDVRGDLVAALVEMYRTLGDPTPAPWSGPSNDERTAQANVHHHYDLGNDFYRLWLDREMVYTCAFFPTRTATLEDAQTAKMDLICRKLRLTPGEHVLEAGCGWGSFALYMARQYGVTVRAFNVSTEQIAYARERARRDGLADRVEFVLDDYRNATGRCDAFVSVGMLEHVGLPDYQALGRVISRSLGPDGRGLLHFIGRDVPSPLNAWIRKRIFPGAYAPPLREVFERVLEPNALSVLDVENLRPHYALTLEHWLRRFEENVDRVRAMFDDRFVRAWRLYLAGSQAAFTTGSLQLFHVVFAPTAGARLPLDTQFVPQRR